MILKGRFIVLFFLFCNINSSFGFQKSDFEIIQERVFENYQSSPATDEMDKDISILFTLIQPNGSFKDLNYADKSMTKWEPDKHIKRLGKMTKAYTRPSSDFYQDEELHDGIIRGMNYWTGLKQEPISDNWWWLSISVPKEIGSMLITMKYGEKQVPKDLENKMIEWMNKTVSITKSPGKDGSNLTDIAQHMIMQAVLTENSDLLNRAVSVVSESIQITKGDGIQRDLSFHAHGPELYMHGYGREYLLGIRNVAVYIVGTSFSFKPAQIALISDFVRNGYLRSMRGKYIDYSVIGRGIARVNATRTNSGLVKQLKAIDIEDHQQEYQDAIDRIDGKKPVSYKIEPRNIHYWRSDYTIHQRPEFLVSLNSASTRTVKTESGNGENLTGQFLTEGAMYIAVKGDEYFNIFPNWEWNKIPGSTTPEINPLKKRTNWVAERGNVDFVGGVSDGLNGVSVYQMNAYNTRANKAWFFFGDKVICLGAGITADRVETINTTVNQSRLRGDVSIGNENEMQVMNSNSTKIDKGPIWIYHDQIGYFFPNSQDIELSAQNQPGAWADINGNSSKKTINEEVFKLYINHGINPKNEKYSYVLMPGIESTSALKEVDLSGIKVERNDEKIQAVSDTGLNLIGVVFYEEGTFEWGENKLTVDKPCLVMLQEYSEGKWNVNLSDPTQLLKGTVKLNLKVDGKSKNFNFSLPDDDYAGSTVSKPIDLN